MREKIQALQTKVIAARHGNPASAVSIVVITGTSGKTTTARFLAAILKESGRSVACLTNDASILDATKLYDRLASLKKQRIHTVILEVNESLYHSGALAGLAIDTLVVTNENDVAQQLLSLVPKHVIVPTSFAVPTGSVEPYQHISFGEDDTADAKVEAVALYRHGTELTMTIDHQTKLEIATHYAGKASALDLAAAVAAAYVQGIHLDAVQEGVADLEPSNDSFKWQRTNQPYEIVHDAAHHDDSIRLATTSAKQLVKRRLITVFDQLPATDTLHFVKAQSDRVFVVGDDDIHDIDNEKTAKEAFDKALRSAKRDDTVLLLGAQFGDFIAQIAPEGETA